MPAPLDPGQLPGAYRKTYARREPINFKH